MKVIGPELFVLSTTLTSRVGLCREVLDRQVSATPSLQGGSTLPDSPSRPNARGADEATSTAVVASSLNHVSPATSAATSAATSDSAGSSKAVPGRCQPGSRLAAGDDSSPGLPEQRSPSRPGVKQKQADPTPPGVAVAAAPKVSIVPRIATTKRKVRLLLASSGFQKLDLGLCRTFMVLKWGQGALAD